MPAWNRCPNLAQYWAILLVYCPEQHLSNLQYTHKRKNWHCSEVHLTFLYCTSSASALSFQHSLLVEKTTVLLMWLAAAALYFTVPMVWFLMEHHALNISLKNRNITLRKVVCWKKIKTCACVNLLHTCSAWPHIHCCSILCPSLCSLWPGCCSLSSHTHLSYFQHHWTHSPPSHPEKRSKDSEEHHYYERLGFSVHLSRLVSEGDNGVILSIMFYWQWKQK